MDSQTINSNQATRSRRLTPVSRRKWSLKEQHTLIDGLKQLCANGWRADNGTFRHGYLMELEHYLLECLPESGLKANPHIISKMKSWKMDYSTIASLKSRSGIGFQYSDGSIVIEDPKAWDDFTKIDPNAKGMHSKKWPWFEDWEEIFGKDRATGEFAEGPLDAVEEIQRSQDQGDNNTSLEIPINVDDEEECDDARNEPNVATGEAENVHTRPSATGASQSEYVGPQQSQEQGKNTKRPSSNVNGKEKCKKTKKTTEYENDPLLKGLMEVLKQFTETCDNKMVALIEKIGERDLSNLREQIYTILMSPAFELYTTEQRIHATMVLCKDVMKMEMFLRMGELD